MYAVLAEESLTRFPSITESTMNAKDSPCLRAYNLISNSTILNNNCFVVLMLVIDGLPKGVCFQVGKEFYKWQDKPNIAVYLQLQVQSSIITKVSMHPLV